MSWGCGFFGKPLWTVIKDAVSNHLPKQLQEKTQAFRSISDTFEQLSKLLEYILAVFE